MISLRSPERNSTAILAVPLVKERSRARVPSSRRLRLTAWRPVAVAVLLLAIATCLFLQKGDLGSYVEAACAWDAAKDGKFLLGRDRKGERQKGRETRERYRRVEREIERETGRGKEGEREG